MDELIARLQQSTGPDRELDEAIHLLVTGKPVKSHCEHCGTHSMWFPRNYTSSIDDALTLLPDDDHHWKAGYSKHVRHNAEVRDLMRPDKGAFIGEHDHGRAIALCIAALRAREHI